jgi:hypothetical protein
VPYVRDRVPVAAAVVVCSVAWIVAIGYDTCTLSLPRFHPDLNMARRLTPALLTDRRPWWRRWFRG